MNIARALTLVVLAARPTAAAAQTQTPPPPPVWETQVGASFVGSSGNSETSTVGADFTAQRRWPVWHVESNASAVRTTDHGERTGERYLGSFRGKRRLTSLLSFTAGERAERDQFAGIDFRNLIDGGLSWALVRTPRWTLDGLTSLAWLHESRALGSDKDNPNGIYQALSRVAFGTGADSMQRVTIFQDFRDTSATRAEAELTAQAALNARLALKFGYLVRHSNDPVPGFLQTDTTATASVVVRWRSLETVPSP